MNWLWIGWAASLIVTGALFWLAFHFWTRSQEFRDVLIDELRREDEQDWIEWQYEYTPSGWRDE